MEDYLAHCRERLSGLYADTEWLEQRIAEVEAADPARKLVEVAQPQGLYWTGLLVSLFGEGQAEVFHSNTGRLIPRDELNTEIVYHQSMNPNSEEKDRFILYRSPEGRKLFESFDGFEEVHNRGV